jgi:glycosyltransferase involved in cell wall biosynthesis
MRILHLIWSFGCGGAESLLVDLANIQSGHDEVCLVVVNDDIDRELLSALSVKIKVCFIGRPPGSRNPWYFLKLNAQILALRPDIIHAHVESLVNVVRMGSVPVVLTLHDTRVNFLANLARYKIVFCISEAVKQDLLCRHPGVVHKVIYNGIDFERVSIKEWQPGLMKSQTDRCFRMVQVSRLVHEKKGQDVLLKALRRVINVLQPGCTIQLDFIGEGPSEVYLKSLASELGISSSVRFLGKQSRPYIYRELQTYDLLVQPSHYEGFGLAIVEAMAANLPVLVSDIEGPMEVIDMGNLGWSFRDGDDADCSAKIMNIISVAYSKEGQERISRTRISAAQKYEIRETADSYRSAYSDILNGLL